MDQPVVLYDGVCNLCNKSVLFILKHEKKPTLKFASLQSSFSVEAKSKHNIPTEYYDSVVLLENGRAYLRSEAALRICSYLKDPWPVMKIFLSLPAFLRDPFYDLLARFRYSWFGKQEQCYIPDDEIKSRFLDI